MLTIALISCDFNPLPPCGGRPKKKTLLPSFLRFQSTPSVWRETINLFDARNTKAYFNPLPPCGGRPDRVRTVHNIFRFQSTPSVWRETLEEAVGYCFYRHFNPLPPCGGRLTSQYFGDNVYISIHSLRVEGDQEPRRCDTGGALISIHSLRVEGDLARLRAR